MLAELGQFSLSLALAFAIIMSVLPMVGSYRDNKTLMLLADSAARGQMLFLLISFGLLTMAFLLLDFSLVYVAQNANSKLPWFYRISAVWGAHEGSLLLWALILGFWTWMIVVKGQHLPLPYRARVLSIMGIISLGFLLFILVTSNPFDRLLPAAQEGRDLNPLLQDPGLIIHPPMLYMGYVGFSVAFAFAVAGLLGGRMEKDWVRWARPWTNVAWGFLTLGIVLGSWWAYYELGWGGWWFWDPVENASFMPWLVGTALVHSLAASEKRGVFKSWTVLLAISAFSLSLLGTFLVRSGVLTSVHAFANDPERGLFILVFLAIVTGGALTVYALKAGTLASRQNALKLVSRESLILAGNVFLACAMATVLLGTLFPLFADLFKLGKISVGPPYFGLVFPLLMAPLVILMPFGPFSRWKKDTPQRLMHKMLPVLIITFLLSGILAMITGPWSFFGLIMLAGGLWTILGSLYYLWQRWQASNSRWNGLRIVPAGITAMVTAHMGIGVFLIGVGMVESKSIELDRRVTPGDSIEIADYQIRFNGILDRQGPNYQSKTGSFSLSRNGERLPDLHPEKRIYLNQEKPMTEAAILGRFTHDLYIALGEPLGNEGAWAIRVYHKPFIRWIWLGGLMMMFGGFIAVLDRRLRSVRLKQSLLAEAQA